MNKVTPTTPEGQGESARHFAQNLVARFRLAIEDIHEYRGEPKGDEYMTMLDRRDQLGEDLVQALTVPSPREVDEDFPTVRDQFAMAALQGLTSIKGEGHFKQATQANFSKIAFEYADAMMAARKGA